MKVEKTMRHNFDALYVIKLLQHEDLPPDEVLRIAGEATNRVMMLEDKIKVLNATIADAVKSLEAWKESLL